jgi:hypothetical protein
MDYSEDKLAWFKRNMNRVRKVDSLDLVFYTSISVIFLFILSAIVAFIYAVPAKTKQVEVQPTRVVKQVVYRAPKPLTPAEQTAEVENIFATVITDKINKNIKGVKFKTNITKDGWSETVIDKKDNIQLKIGGVK